MPGMSMPHIIFILEYIAVINFILSFFLSFQIFERVWRNLGRGLECSYSLQIGLIISTPDCTSYYLEFLVLFCVCIGHNNYYTCS